MMDIDPLTLYPDSRLLQSFIRKYGAVGGVASSMKKRFFNQWEFQLDLKSFIIFIWKCNLKEIESCMQTLTLAKLFCENCRNSLRQSDGFVKIKAF